MLSVRLTILFVNCKGILFYLYLYQLPNLVTLFWNDANLFKEYIVRSNNYKLCKFSSLQTAVHHQGIFDSLCCSCRNSRLGK